MTMPRVVCMLAVLAACGHAPDAAAPRPSSDDAVLVIASPQKATAELVIDGRVQGPLRKIGSVALEAGHYHIELRQDDYFTGYLDVQLAPREHKTVTLDLAPILP